jgi:hypothetical protein
MRAFLEDRYELRLADGWKRCAFLNGIRLNKADYHYIKHVRTLRYERAQFRRLDVVFDHHDIDWWEYEQYAARHGLEPYVAKTESDPEVQQPLDLRAQ